MTDGVISTIQPAPKCNSSLQVFCLESTEPTTFDENTPDTGKIQASNVCKIVENGGGDHECYWEIYRRPRFRPEIEESDRTDQTITAGETKEVIPFNPASIKKICSMEK